MSGFAVALGPKAFGGEVLVHIAKHRLTGLLRFGGANKTREIGFREGRPQRAFEEVDSSDKEYVVAAVRRFAALSVGKCRFQVAEVASTSLGIDTLGETLVAMARLVTPLQLDAFWAARARYTLEPGPAFERMSKLIAKTIGVEAIAAPPSGATVSSYTAKLDPKQQRVVAVLMVLGGLATNAAPLRLEPLSDEAQESLATQPAALAQGGLSPEAQALAREITETCATLEGKTHYEVLGVSAKASAEEIRKAYFSMAKKYHSDRLRGLALPPDIVAMAEEIFRMAESANTILSNADERSSYDWVLDRTARGLPTDPKVILEAESLFRKAEGLLRRGQAQAAEPILRRVVEMNRGEAEFWACLGYAVYLTYGNEKLGEARSALTEALKINEKLDIAFEFLGRIAHAEGQLKQAQENLEHCLSLNPKNPDAARELRLLTMRAQGKAEAEKERSSTLLGRLFKK